MNHSSFILKLTPLSTHVELGLHRRLDLLKFSGILIVKFLLIWAYILHRETEECLCLIYRLINCGITYKGCAALASALKSNLSHLRHLNLSGNKLQDKGVDLLSAGLKDPHCKLETLW